MADPRYTKDIAYQDDVKRKIQTVTYRRRNGWRGLYANINARKRKAFSTKSKSTITAKAYANMKAGFPKKKGKKG